MAFQRVPGGEIGAGVGWRMDFGGRSERETKERPTGIPPVIHRGAYDGARKRAGVLQNVNLGGIAEVYAFVPCMGTEAFFSFWKHSQ